MAFTYIPNLWAVGQKAKASVLNVMVNAITELQAQLDLVSGRVSTLETIHWMEKKQNGVTPHANGTWLAVPVVDLVDSAGTALSNIGNGIRVNVAGRYYCEAWFTNTATTNRKSAGVVINSGPPVKSFTVSAVSGGLQIGMELPLAVNDMIYPAAYHDSGSTINCSLGGLIVRKLPA